MAKIRKSAKRQVLVLHGPNLNLLGTREPEVYGRETLKSINGRLAAAGRAARVAIPFIEVHLSTVHSREAFRQRSYFSDLAVGVICGLGSRGYDFALQFALSSAPDAGTKERR